VLIKIIKKRIKDNDAMWLIEKIIDSYLSQSRERERDEVRAESPLETSLPKYLPISILMNLISL